MACLKKYFFAHVPFFFFFIWRLVSDKSPGLRREIKGRNKEIRISFPSRENHGRHWRRAGSSEHEISDLSPQICNQTCRCWRGSPVASFSARATRSANNVSPYRPFFTIKKKNPVAANRLLHFSLGPGANRRQWRKHWRRQSSRRL